MKTKIGPLVRGHAHFTRQIRGLDSFAAAATERTDLRRDSQDRERSFSHGRTQERQKFEPWARCWRAVLEEGFFRALIHVCVHRRG
jgi:hypothetical protein